MSIITDYTRPADNAQVTIYIDTDAGNPLEDYNPHGIGVARKLDRDRYDDAGDTSLIRDMDRWQDERDSLDYDREDMGPDAYAAALAELGTAPATIHEVTNTDLHGHPTFLVYLPADLPEGLPEGVDRDELANITAMDYTYWAEGHCYAVAVDYPDGRSDCIGGWLGHPDAAEIDEAMPPMSDKELADLARAREEEERRAADTVSATTAAIGAGARVAANLADLYTMETVTAARVLDMLATSEPGAEVEVDMAEADDHAVMFRPNGETVHLSMESRAAGNARRWVLEVLDAGQVLAMYNTGNIAHMTDFTALAALVVERIIYNR